MPRLALRKKNKFCRRIEAEARVYYDKIIDLADMEAATGYANHFRGGDSKGRGNHVPRERILGGNVHFPGSPQQVADWLVALNRADCDGMQISFYDFREDLELFGSEVLPLLYDAGVRLRQ